MTYFMAEEWTGSGMLISGPGDQMQPITSFCVAHGNPPPIRPLGEPYNTLEVREALILLNPEGFLRVAEDTYTSSLCVKVLMIWLADHLLTVFQKCL